MVTPFCGLDCVGLVHGMTEPLEYVTCQLTIPLGKTAFGTPETVVVKVVVPLTVGLAEAVRAIVGTCLEMVNG